MEIIYIGNQNKLKETTTKKTNSTKKKKKNTTQPQYIYPLGTNELIITVRSCSIALHSLWDPGVGRIAVGARDETVFWAEEMMPEKHLAENLALLLKFCGRG